MKRWSSLRVRILLITTLCWLLPTLVLGSYMGGVFFGALREKTEAYLSSNAQHAHAMALEDVERMIRLSKDVTYDGTLENAAAVYRRSDEKYQDFYRTCRIYLDQRFSRERTAKFVLFFLNEFPQRMMYTLGNEKGVNLFKTEALDRVLEMQGPLDTSCRFVSQGEELYLVRNLYDRHLIPFGMLVICLDKSKLFAPIYAASPQLGALDVALDEYVSPGFLPESQQLGLMDDGKRLLFTQVSKTRDYQFTTRFAQDKHIVYAQSEQYSALMLALLLGLLPVAAMILAFSHRRISRPLDKLAQASLRIQQGELGVTVPMKGYDEIGQAGRAFSAMSLRLRELIDKSYKEEILLRDARIMALQSRVNPHFLNNALEIINWQARMDSNGKIGAMIDALSVLLDASLGRGNSRLVALREELSIADAYFYFLTLRFGKRLEVKKELDASLLDQEIPHLIIQTLLENAVEHGIAPAGGGQICLNIHRYETQLIIEVLNSGRGLDQQDRERISRLLADEETQASEHMGLRNIAQRLRLLYGDKAQLTITQDKQGRTVARLQLPPAPMDVETGQ